MKPMTTPLKNRRGRWSQRIPMLASLAVLAVGIAGAQPARADIFTPGVQDQIRLGDQAASQLMRQYRILHDDRASHLSEVGNRLVDALGKDRGPWHWSYALIDSKEMNAFALPGGHVFMFSGLYDKLNNDDEIAAVMGHEMTHVRKQHWAHEVGDQTKRQALLSVVLDITRAGQGWQTLAGLGDTMLTLKFSRHEEEQADLGGLQNMVAAGYNPHGMIQLFHVLQSGEHGSSPEFLSDHPLTSHRIQAAEQAITRMGYQP